MTNPAEPDVINAIRIALLLWCVWRIARIEVGRTGMANTLGMIGVFLACLNVAVSIVHWTALAILRAVS